jgi:hypothetical protein
MIDRASAPRGSELPWSAAASRLLPRLRSGAWLQHLLLEQRRRARAEVAAQRPDEPPCCHHQLADDLYLTLVVDDADTMTTVCQPSLESWQVSFEHAVETARHNLAERRAEDLVALAPGLWMGPWEDAYAASRLLLVPGIAPVAEPLAAIPNRDTLLLADGRDPTALENMVTALGRLEGCEYPIGAAIHRCRASGALGPELEPVRLPKGHPAAVTHHNLLVRERLRAYADEQWPLQQLLGPEPYVASAEADADADGALVSRALWTEGVVTLLPATERIHLLPASRDGVTSRLWVTSLGALLQLPRALEPTADPLPRFATRRFPSELELRRIATLLERDGQTAELDPKSGWRAGKG